MTSELISSRLHCPHCGKLSLASPRSSWCIQNITQGYSVAYWAFYKNWWVIFNCCFKRMTDRFWITQPSRRGVWSCGINMLKPWPDFSSPAVWLRCVCGGVVSLNDTLYMHTSSSLELFPLSILNSVHSAVCERSPCILTDCKHWVSESVTSGDNQWSLAEQWRLSPLKQQHHTATAWWVRSVGDPEHSELKTWKLSVLVSGFDRSCYYLRQALMWIANLVLIAPLSLLSWDHSLFAINFRILEYVFGYIILRYV